MVMTNEEQIGLNIQLENPNQGTNTEDIIIIIWFREILDRKQFNCQEYHSLNSNVKKSCYIQKYLL